VLESGLIKAIDKICQEFKFKTQNQTFPIEKNDLVCLCFHLIGNLTGCD